MTNLRHQLLRSVLGAAALAAAVAVSGCGDSAPHARVRVLQVDPASLVAPEPGPRGAPPAVATSRRVRASLTAVGVGTVPPPLQIPNVGSIAVGSPNAGRLVNGLELPATGTDWLTWDAILHRTPNRPDRRYGTDRLLAFLVAVLRDYRLANPGAPPVLVGDLSRPYGGPFGSDFGGLGHASHQNGLDVDVLYPRADRLLLPPGSARDVDRALAQDLVNRFVAAGAQFAFVGLRVGLGGPPHVVQAIEHHDDHVHVRIANARR